MIEEDHTKSRIILTEFFVQSIQEMYYTENKISAEFSKIKDQIGSPKLLEILKIHYSIHLKHLERIEKIFTLSNEKMEIKNCEALNAIISEAKSHLAVFSEDPVNWEIALILVTQKLAYFKIASYGGLTHLAIKLNYHSIASLLAFCVQEEEEFLSTHLNGIFDAFLAAHVEGYKSDLN